MKRSFYKRFARIYDMLEWVCIWEIVIFIISVFWFGLAWSLKTFIGVPYKSSALVTIGIISLFIIGNYIGEKLNNACELGKQYIEEDESEENDK